MPIQTEVGGQATPVGGLVPVKRDGHRVVRSTAITKRRDPRSGTDPMVPKRRESTGLSENGKIEEPNGTTATAAAHGGSTVEHAVENTVKRGFRGPPRRGAVVCLVLVVGIAAVLVPALRTVWRSLGERVEGSVGAYLGQSIGQLLLEGGIPPTGPLLGLEDTGETTLSGNDNLTTDSMEITTGGAEDAPGDPSEPDTSEPLTTPDTATEITPPEEPTAEPEDDSDENPGLESEPNDAVTRPPTHAEEISSGDDISPETGTSSDAETGKNGDFSADETRPSEDDTSSENINPDNEKESDSAALNPPVSIPVGCYPILSRDLSESTRGAGYIHNEAGTLPDALPGGNRWPQGTPTVLLIHTHPYEGYSDGGSYYDPSTGALAVTDSPNDPDGVVALGTRLTRTLRGQGITVIHLRVAVSPGETSDTIYARTAALVRYYCRLYPDIGLVIDLRRSAELTADGGVLRTEGQLRGNEVAQIRLTVNGGRSSAAVARDLEVALALRARLWAVDPSLSRPVRVRSGEGLAGDVESDADNATGPVVLSVEFGSAGNTFSEAVGLVGVMAEAICAELCATQ